MSDVIIGKGNLAGKGVYANKDFKKGEAITGDATQDDVPKENKLVIQINKSTKEVFDFALSPANTPSG